MVALDAGGRKLDALVLVELDIGTLGAAVIVLGCCCLGASALNSVFKKEPIHKHITRKRVEI